MATRNVESASADRLFTRITFAMLLAMLIPSVSLAADAKPSTYKGWKSLSLSNNLVELHIVPALGGRVIQFNLANHEYLWVNPQLLGKLPPPSGLAPDGGWLNYGGDKLWPAPQGWDNDEQWPGPPDAILDGSPHTPSLLDHTSVKLVSRKDPRTGIQFSRIIRIADNAAHVSFDSTMTNIDPKPRRWAIWQVTQLNAANSSADGYNKLFRCYSPLNPTSLFPRGYSETYGLVNNPSFSLDHANKLVVVHYKRLVGKMGVDNTAGWVAAVDGAAGYAFVERFTYYPGQKYPDDHSATFWLNGPGQIVTGDKIATIDNDPVQTPPYVESEIVSPLATLKPGESYSFHLDWYATKIGGDYPILNCTPAGVTCQPFTATLANGRLHLTGRFGVFQPGHVNLDLLDASGAVVASLPLKLPASPLEPLLLSRDEPSTQASTASLVLYDSSAKRIGELARAAIQR